MINHESRKTLAVHQDYAWIDVLNVLMSLWAEATRSDEDTLSCPLPVQCADKLLDLWTPDGLFPPLSLYVDHLETKTVFVDDPSIPPSATACVIEPASGFPPP
jgi:hypothetical protein